MQGKPQRILISLLVQKEVIVYGSLYSVLARQALCDVLKMP